MAPPVQAIAEQSPKTCKRDGAQRGMQQSNSTQRSERKKRKPRINANKRECIPSKKQGTHSWKRRWNKPFLPFFAFLLVSIRVHSRFPPNSTFAVLTLTAISALLFMGMTFRTWTIGIQSQAKTPPLRHPLSLPHFPMSKADPFLRFTSTNKSILTLNTFLVMNSPLSINLLESKCFTQARKTNRRAARGLCRRELFLNG